MANNTDESRRRAGGWIRTTTRKFPDNDPPSARPSRARVREPRSPLRGYLWLFQFADSGRRRGLGEQGVAPGTWKVTPMLRLTEREGRDSNPRTQNASVTTRHRLANEQRSAEWTALDHLSDLPSALQQVTRSFGATTRAPWQRRETIGKQETRRGGSKVQFGNPDAAACRGRRARLEPATPTVTRLTTDHRPAERARVDPSRFVLCQLSYLLQQSRPQIQVRQARARPGGVTSITVTPGLRPADAGRAGLEPATTPLRVGNDRPSAHRVSKV